MKITKFEDIQAWQAARQLTNLAYEATEASAFNDGRKLRWQIRDAAGSCMANIAEGFDAGADKEFARFLRIAQRSATELQSHLYVALDRHFLESPDFDRLYAKAADVRRMIGGFIRYLKNPRVPDRVVADVTKD